MNEKSMSAKHTPGPWTQGTSKIGLTCVWLDGMIEQRDGKGLGPENTWIDCNTEANARLIAAAPDLLAALREVFSLDASLIRDIYGSEFVDRASAAITKAIG